MRIFLLVLMSISLGYGAKVVAVDERYQDSTNCKTCHKRIVDEWNQSWHAKSHFKNDEYFRKSMEYVSRKTRKSINSVKIECATCHNPRISVTSTDTNYEIAAVMGLDKGSAVNKAVNDDAISEGINCVVCHNIDKIHDEYDKTKRGINRVEWTASGTMTGPYDDAISPYHKTVHHDFMDKTPNRLCFVCHANDRSVHDLEFTNMEAEYQGDQACVSCHMGPVKKDVAATYKFNGKSKMRDVRSHGFMGGHVASMWENALSLEMKQSKSKILITIANPQPHNIPSGFGARELLVELQYKDRSGKVIEEKTLSLTTHYTRRGGKESTPHMARKQTKNMSIPAKGKKVLKVERVKGAQSLEARLSYRLVNDEVKTLLDIKDPIFSEKFLIAEETLQLK